MDTASSPAPPWFPRMTRPFCSPTRAWSSSRKSSRARKSGTIPEPPPRRNACAWAANTTTWKMSGARPGTTPFSRCSATSPLATISRRKPFAWPGISSPWSWAWTRTASMSPSSARTTRPASCGKKWPACRRTASSAWTRRTISGPWATPAPAVRARKFMSIRARTWPAARTAASASATATGSWKSGTWSSCSSTGPRTEP